MRIVSPQDVSRLGTILSVWAHPDDESLLAGGLLAAAIRGGQNVICLTATRGEAGIQDESRWPAAKLGDIRTTELHHALQVLGVARHHWLGYADGACRQADEEEATAKIAAFITQYRPDSIVTFGPDGWTGHPDHQSVGRWASLAAQRVPRQLAVYQAVCQPEQYHTFLRPLDKKINIFFNIDHPPLIPKQDCAIALELTPELLQQKVRALAAMPSQMERLLRLVPRSAQPGTFGYEYFVRS